MNFAFLTSFVAATVHELQLTWEPTRVTLDSLEVGDTVKLTGEENPSTGYTWTICDQNSNDVYTITNDSYTDDYHH